MTLPASPQAESCYSLFVNHWWCPSYLHAYQSQLESATRQHAEITVISVLLGLVIALPLAVVARRFTRVEAAILGAATVVYTVPSLALFPLLVPFTGITERTVVIGLALYSLTILIRNTLAGLRAVPRDVLESAAGMGYGPTRMLLTVEFPLAMPVIMAGLRVATVSTVALTTIGTIVSYGGLGNLLAQGVQQNFKAQILAASVLCVLLALAFDIALLGIQRVLTPWTWKRG
ncbi:MAG: osmoprotectant transport system permease protein [Nocardioidaceae bacterium]|nr:osmoprotectant transport system permease protein [Nocardioidaceae bacterium]MDX6308052.1 osmoprotectant transport system permease protein [Nocardioidaceae bacterium]